MNVYSYLALFSLLCQVIHH